LILQQLDDRGWGVTLIFGHPVFDHVHGRFRSQGKVSPHAKFDASLCEWAIIWGARVAKIRFAHVACSWVWFICGRGWIPMSTGVSGGDAVGNGGSVHCLH